jgi:hypothetical protein
MERMLVNLMLRNFEELEQEVFATRLADEGSDGALASSFEQRLDSIEDDQPAMEGDGESFVLDGAV